VEYVYRAAGVPAEVLARVATLARTTPGVDRVFARVPVPGVPRLADAHPEWHLDHDHAGDLLLIAVPGRQFVDPGTTTEWRLRGNHGGPENTLVPLVVTGGHPALRAVAAGGETPRTVDLAPTIAGLLGVRTPERLDGAPIAPAARGHTLNVTRPETASRVGRGRERGASGSRAGVVPRPAEPARQN